MARKKNDTIAVSIIKATPDATPVEATKKTVAIKEIQTRRKYHNTASQVAESDFYKKNYMYDGGKKTFPDNPELWYVNKFFPYAKQGPLFVDEPKNDIEETMCDKKRSVVEKNGHKYLIIKKGMSDVDCIEAML